MSWLASAYVGVSATHKEHQRTTRSILSLSDFLNTFDSKRSPSTEAGPAPSPESTKDNSAGGLTEKIKREIQDRVPGAQTAEQIRDIYSKFGRKLLEVWFWHTSNIIYAIVNASKYTGFICPDTGHMTIIHMNRLRRRWLEWWWRQYTIWRPLLRYY